MPPELDNGTLTPADRFTRIEKNCEKTTGAIFGKIEELKTDIGSVKNRVTWVCAAFVGGGTVLNFFAPTIKALINGSV